MACEGNPGLDPQAAREAPWAHAGTRGQHIQTVQRRAPLPERLHTRSVSTYESNPPTTSEGDLRPRRRAWWYRTLRALVGSVLLLLIGRVAVLAFGDVDLERPWYAGSQDRAGLAPDAGDGARGHGPGLRSAHVRSRGAFAIHPWIAFKRSGAAKV
jgi:hypothetical protein